MENTELIEDLKLRNAELTTDLDQALIIFHGVIGLIGLSVADLKNEKLEMKKIVKGINGIVFQASGDPEGFAERVDSFVPAAKRLGFKYEERILELTNGK